MQHRRDEKRPLVAEAERVPQRMRVEYIPHSTKRRGGTGFCGLGGAVARAITETHHAEHDDYSG